MKITSVTRTNRSRYFQSEMFQLQCFHTKLKAAEGGNEITNPYHYCCVASTALGYAYSALTYRTWARVADDSGPSCLKICGCGPAVDRFTRSCGISATCYVSLCTSHISIGGICAYP